MPKRKIRIIIDFLMTIILLMLMAYQITGQKFHEYLGTAMLILFLVHNALNRKWYANLMKGKYTSFRVFQVIVNFGVLFSMLSLGFSGMVMSRYVFAAFLTDGPMATARHMHMAASYWGFVLMSLHLGMHWGQVHAIFRKIFKRNNVILWIARIASGMMVGYGFWCFMRNQITAYMFLKNEFVFFDFEKTAIQVIVEYIGMMGLWIFVGYWRSKIIRIKKR